MKNFCTKSIEFCTDACKALLVMVAISLLCDGIASAIAMMIQMSWHFLSTTVMFFVNLFM